MHRLRPVRGLRRHLVAALLVLPLILSSFGDVPRTAAGDPLHDALNQQKALQAKIASQRKQIADLKATEADLQATIDETTQTLNKVNADQASAKASLDKANKSLTKVRNKYLDLVKQVAELDAEVDSLQAQLDQAQADLVAKRAQLAGNIAEAYKTQQTSLLEQLLMAKTLSEALADVGYYLHIGDANKALADEISQRAADVAQLKQATEEARAQTQETRLEVYAQKNTMTKQRDAVAKAKKKLDALQKRTAAAQARQQAAYASVRQTKAQAAKALAQEQEALGQLQHKIDQLLATQQGIPSAYNGTLTWPMAGDVTQEFGCTGFAYEPPLGGCAHFHTGIDIVAPEYSAIRAAGDGVVLFVGPNPYDPPWARAWIVIIAHSQSLTTWYAHIDASSHPPAVSKGQFVQQGQVIAYEGNTGNSTGPHLHWAVELNGTFVNPRLFI